MVSLGKRLRDGHVYLSRETFLSPMKLEHREASIREERSDYQTIIINEGEGKIPDSYTRPNLPWTPVPQDVARDDFNGDKLALKWNLRCVPTTQWYTLQKGRLVIDVRPETVKKAKDNPSLVAQRIRDFEFEATTKMEFKAASDDEQAGLTLYRNDKCYMMFTRKGSDVVLETNMQGEEKELFRAPYKKSGVVLKMVSDGKDVSFYYGSDEKSLEKISATAPLVIISDLMQNFYNGPMVGVYVSSNGAASNNNATFDWFEYK